MTAVAVVLAALGVAVSSSGRAAAPDRSEAAVVEPSPTTVSAPTTSTTTTGATPGGPATIPPVEPAERPVPLGAAPPAVTPAAEPATVAIPAIGVRSELEQLALLADGTVQPPVDPARAGWFRGGARPGAKGPAVIAGHLDWTDGPAVFARLADVEPGDLITVTDAAGAEHTFEATAVERHPKQDFPTEAVYGPVPGAALRLVTCGGAFNRRTGHYLDNIVVFAQLVSGR